MHNGVKAYNVFWWVIDLCIEFCWTDFWSLSGLQLLYEPSLLNFNGPATTDLLHYTGLKKSILLVKSLISLFFYTVSAVNLVGSCINLRFHLFIWTVFLPNCYSWQLDFICQCIDRFNFGSNSIVVLKTNILL